MPPTFYEGLMPKHPKFGATGKFPEGKLGPDDEGELTLGIAADPKNNIVRIEFGKPVAWVGLPPDKAIQFANVIIAKAATLLKN